MEIIVKHTPDTIFEKFGQNAVIFKDFYIYISSDIEPLSSKSTGYCLALFTENNDGDVIIAEFLYSSTNLQKCKDKAKQLNMYFVY